MLTTGREDLWTIYFKLCRLQADAIDELAMHVKDGNGVAVEGTALTTRRLAVRVEEARRQLEHGIDWS